MAPLSNKTILIDDIIKMIRNAPRPKGMTYIFEVNEFVKQARNTGLTEEQINQVVKAGRISNELGTIILCNGNLGDDDEQRDGQSKGGISGWIKGES